jgi:hypothetical protein
MRSLGLAIRFLVFALLAPVIAVITLVIFISNPEFIFLSKRREEAFRIWTKAWSWVGLNEQATCVK